MENDNRTIGQKIADAVTKFMASWPCIIGMTSIIIIWVIINTIKGLMFDSYPYVFLNLILGIISAFSAPLIMMSQSRQTSQDRESLLSDLKIEKEVLKEVKELRNEINILISELKILRKN